ncbi:MAG TPA: hypothetical protein VIL28_15030 [Steroidobacteraceae bacterium]
MKPSSQVVAAASSYDDMPLSIVLFRYLWPFWLFKDASRGDRMARAAAYRHNRTMRVHLPRYLMRWFVSSTFVLGLTSAADALAATSPVAPGFLSFLTAGFALIFCFSVCVLFVTSYVYLYLSRNE